MPETSSRDAEKAPAVENQRDDEATYKYPSMQKQIVIMLAVYISLFLITLVIGISFDPIIALWIGSPNNMSFPCRTKTLYRLLFHESRTSSTQ